MQRLNISHLMSGGLITNYYCSSRCRHCLYRCSPRWPKEFITEDTARANLQTMKRLNCFSIHIGGGEPLLNPEAVLRILNVANELGVHVEYVETNSSWFKDLKTACDHYGENYTKSILDRYWVSAGGRALDLISEFSPQYSVEDIIQKNRGGCKELANTSHFHFDLYGNYVPGLCAGLSVRREDMGEPLSEADYPLLTLLFNNGIGGLLDFVRETYHFKESKTSYANKCELCAEIRFFLVNEKGIVSRELQPKMHYGDV